jgi:hypothetical protein
MSRRLILDPDAEQDLDDIFDYIAQHNPTAAARAAWGKVGIDEVNALLLPVARDHGFADVRTLSSETMTQEWPRGLPTNRTSCGGGGGRAAGVVAQNAFWNSDPHAALRPRIPGQYPKGEGLQSGTLVFALTLCCWGSLAAIAAACLAASPKPQCLGQIARVAASRPLIELHNNLLGIRVHNVPWQVVLREKERGFPLLQEALSDSDETLRSLAVHRLERTPPEEPCRE